MGLRDFFRRHGNVFSVSSREVDDVNQGDEEMLVEEYGRRAVEAERPAGWAGRGRAGLATVQPYASADELGDGDPPADSASR
jgi:hypothetical protein